ncbi:thiol reductant ABC exporter subunit CydD [Desulforamulus ferrireducens]|uniref:Thiol reductant ABC exporter subunit CydD n=1 Tax=Desulforamulus ferrireducens TaxID=1833852 RepID=A0A1S6IW33_9FIRM|nr:thiol reductant ABC exporter subunit CydD [Desulforamulus ferrireducens]AQS58976.1 thiol reductant ABC exporter subunit CydD [Desulforamulus ferrireducens]
MLDKRLLGEAKKVRFYLALTVGLGLATGLLIVWQAANLASIINDVFLLNQTLSQVWHSLLLLLAVILLRALLSWFTEVMAQRAAAQIKASLRRQLLQHLLALGPVHARGERTGELVNLLTEGIEVLDDYFAQYLPKLVLAALIPILILFFVFPIDLTSGLILLFTAPLIPFFMILIGKWADHLTKRQWVIMSRMSAHFLDVLQGLTTLKFFGRSKDQARVIARISDDFRKTTLGVLRVAFLSALVLELLSTISTALMAVTLGLRLVYDRIPFQEAFFLLLLAPEFYLPLRNLGSQFHGSMSGVNVANRIFEVLSLPLPREEGGQGVPRGGLHLELQDVTFSYAGANQPALASCSFALLPGQVVALVGPSGAGKTTLAQLLLRFIEPERGTIKVGGIPLSQINAAEWRNQVAFLPQHPYLFYGTVADNILLGRPEATLAEVMEAAKLAGAHQFISELPQGYQTPVGEGGIRLSGGEAQRLAIARAFLKNAPLLILDEATTGLDPANEQAVQEALHSLMQGRTVLVIAHRMSTIYQADHILVMEQGRIVEQGRHEQLLAKHGLYYRLVAAYRGETA